MDNGTRLALIPISNKRNSLNLSADIVEKVDLVLYSDPLGGLEGFGHQLSE